MSLTQKEAYEMAEKLIVSYASEESEALVLLDNETIAIKDGWVFFYNTKKFQDTNDYVYALAGNCPIFINSSGDIKLLRTAIPLKEALEEI